MLSPGLAGWYKLIEVPCPSVARPTRKYGMQPKLTKAIPPQRDAFPTTKLSIPNIATIVWRLRDEGIGNSVTIVHAGREGEGEWALAIAAARIARKGTKVFGPEPLAVLELLEHGLHIGAKVIFAGELRRLDEARAVRVASTMDARIVATITTPSFDEAQKLFDAMGPWMNCNTELISIAGGRR